MATKDINDFFIAEKVGLDRIKIGGIRVEIDFQLIDLNICQYNADTGEVVEIKLKNGSNYLKFHTKQIVNEEGKVELQGNLDLNVGRGELEGNINNLTEVDYDKVISAAAFELEEKGIYLWFENAYYTYMEINVNLIMDKKEYSCDNLKQLFSRMLVNMPRMHGHLNRAINIVKSEGAGFVEGDILQSWAKTKDGQKELTVYSKSRDLRDKRFINLEKEIVRIEYRLHYRKIEEAFGTKNINEIRDDDIFRVFAKHVVENLLKYLTVTYPKDKKIRMNKILKDVEEDINNGKPINHWQEVARRMCDANGNMPVVYHYSEIDEILKEYYKKSKLADSDIQKRINALKRACIQTHAWDNIPEDGVDYWIKQLEKVRETYGCYWKVEFVHVVW